ncbi:subtilisin-like protease SBT1.8 [Magnolia sinica]|uniref:subtilisin-like protease SBT1.8 n=1 Tax=Magnolia sinica TaxID=86752 RepID=UPI002659C58D|nr:subtilisin-like protease SBT1.8 [Magnolia sinica]
MDSLRWSMLFCLLSLSLTHATKQTYIVHMNKNHKQLSYTTDAHWYTDHLHSLSINASTALLYTYDSVLSGFAAALDSSEAEALRRSETVLSIYPDILYHLHTTHTPDFLGLNTKIGHQNQDHLDQDTEDVIIGFLDTGIWPESPSFNDSGMPKIPSRWRGECERGVDFSPSACNRKLIGARSFWKGMAQGGKLKEITSARDRNGHGTHTASTAAGSPVVNASLYGYALGTARGMAPRARVAAYKVCWNVGCSSSDILAGLDAAIADGVDILSISLGHGGALSYELDTISIGAFAAVDHGIFVACSAGNNGPYQGFVDSVAPWIMTVGAGSIDRNFPAVVSLGNGKQYDGVSLYSGKGMGAKMLPVIYNVSKDASFSESNLCLPDTLSAESARGKVVVCDQGGGNSQVEKGLVVKKAGGAAMIIADMTADKVLQADSHVLPALSVGRKISGLIKEYIRSSRNPTAVISFRGTVLNVKPSPVVAAFSSRGPNLITPGILKPDLFGPGLNILAAWTGLAAPTGLQEDIRRTNFNVKSGTSMSCPHITGVAALLKATHPKWSPNAIKSALITTAYAIDNVKLPIRDAAGGASTPFAHGAGHVNPQKALSPGLIYDITTEDYVAFLCKELKYVDMQNVVRNTNITCNRTLSDVGDLNYPSFSVLFGNKRRVVKYSREVTNVGPAQSSYNITIGGPASFVITVRPTRLSFSKVGQKLRYEVTFVLKKARKWNEAFGWITLSNEQYHVRSPVAYIWNSYL